MRNIILILLVFIFNTTLVKASNIASGFEDNTDFKNKNPNIEFRRVFDYGYSGRAFIVTNLD